MGGLIALLAFISLIIISILLTKRIKSILWRIPTAIAVFWIMYFSILPEHFYSSIIEPIYCNYHKNEKIVVYTTPEEWKKITNKNININLIVEPYDESDLVTLYPSSYDFNYKTEITFQEKPYTLTYVSEISPYFVFYKHKKGDMFYKEEYLYYDVNKDAVILGLTQHFIRVPSFIFEPHIHMCENPKLSLMNNYFSHNYLSQL